MKTEGGFPRGLPEEVRKGRGGSPGDSEDESSERLSGSVASADTLRALEYPRALEEVAARASSPFGANRIMELRPGRRRHALERELASVAEAARLLEERPGWRPPEIPDVEGALFLLDTPGTVLGGEELWRLGILLASGEALLRAIGGSAPEGAGGRPNLEAVARRLRRDAAEVEAVRRTVDEEGAVLDGASRELGRLRRAIKRARRGMIRRLESFLRSLPQEFVVSDASVTIRDGRYVIPVRREGRREVGGAVRDRSGSGATLFIEPPVASEMMNELRELEWKEGREVERILGEFTARLRARREELAESFDALADFDALYARARCAIAWDGAIPTLLAPEESVLEVVRARHPLLLACRERVVPFDLRLEPHERALVVSGPNAGGKSVFLKAMGLISALAQSGIVPPIGPGSRLPLFETIFADIGEEQSIAENLSTFSAHLANLRTIAEEAGPRSLVLVDEIGRGTDPSEGAALSRAVLEHLVSSGALTICTSHLGALKRLDAAGSGIVNTSLHFDVERLEPDYRLVKGRPGRSYALVMVRRLGFPDEIVLAAEGHLSEGEASVDDLLESLEEKEREARDVLGAAVAERRELDRLGTELRTREGELRERERSAAKRAEEEARRMLLAARSEVEEAIRELREASGEDLSEASRQARGRVEKAVRRHRKGREDRRLPPVPSDGIREGSRVRVGEGSTSGTVAEVREGRAVVRVSGIRLEVALGELSPLPDREGSRPAVREAAAERWRHVPHVPAATEVRLLGLRVDQVDGELLRAVDAAVLADLPELRVVHGKGSGALRARVAHVLRDDSRIESFGSARPAEGGHGVTIVRFR